MYHERNDIAESVDYRADPFSEEEEEIDTLTFRALVIRARVGLIRSLSANCLAEERNKYSGCVQPDNDRYDRYKDRRRTVDACSVVLRGIIGLE